MDRHVEQVFGLRGINDALYRREDWATLHPAVADNPNTPENESQPAYTDGPEGRYDSIGSGAADLAIYQLADPQGSVAAVLADTLSPGLRAADEVDYPVRSFTRGERVSFQRSSRSSALNVAGTVLIRDVESNDEAVAIVRYDESRVMLCLSLRSNGELEIVMDKVDAVKLIEALAAATRGE